MRHSGIGSLVFTALFATVMLAAAGMEGDIILLYVVLQTAIQATAVVVHELAHLVCARAFGVRATLYWHPVPTVICQDIGSGAARAVAIVGPVCGAAFGVAALCMVISLFHASALLYAIPAAIGGSHLAMLSPRMADGRLLCMRI